MKYELPDDLKRYKFFCEDTLVRTDFEGCKLYCHSDYRHCWQYHLRMDLGLDCTVENERKAESYVTCSKCGKPCTGLAFHKFLCPDCGNIEYYDVKAQKAVMGDAYAEIDEQELNDAFNAIK